MKFKIYVTKDFDHMSQVAANITVGKVTDFVPTKEKPYLSLILPTGNSPTGMYKIMAERQDTFDPSIIVSHNLDEYIGLPGDTPEQRREHGQSYTRFMRKHLFDKVAFHKWHIPKGCEIDQERLERELEKHQNDFSACRFVGIQDKKQGLAITIPKKSSNNYLGWIKSQILDDYTKSIRENGRVDLTIVGVGGRGHIAFHESGIPLDLEMLLVQLDENTIENAVRDGQFPSVEQSPKYAVSMGAGFVYNPEYNSEVLLLANGPRKTGPITEALLGPVTNEVPISGCQEFAKSGKVIWVVDEEASRNILGKESRLQEKGIQLSDLR